MTSAPPPSPEDYRVVLEDASVRRLDVLRAVREVVALDLRAAKAFLEALPREVVRGVARVEAIRIARRLEAAGARVRVEEAPEPAPGRAEVLPAPLALVAPGDVVELVESAETRDRTLLASLERGVVVDGVGASGGAFEDPARADAARFARCVLLWRTGWMTDDAVLRELPPVPIPCVLQRRRAMIERERGAIERVTNAGHAGRVTLVRIFGDVAFTGGAEGKVVLWDVARGARLREFDGAGGIVSLAWDPASGLVLAGGDGGAAFAWEITTARRVATLDCGGVPVSCVAVAPGGHWCATGSGREIRVWAVPPGELASGFTESTGCPVRLALDPDGRTLRSVNDKGSLRTWDWTAAKELARSPFALRSGLPFPLRARPDHEFRAVAPEGGRNALTISELTARLWSAEGPQCVTTVELPDFVSEAALSADARFWLLGHETGKVTRVAYEPGERAPLVASREERDTTPAAPVEPTPPPRRVLAGEGGAGWIDLEGNRVLQEDTVVPLEGAELRTPWCPRPDTLVAGCDHDSRVSVWAPVALYPDVAERLGRASSRSEQQPIVLRGRPATLRFDGAGTVVARWALLAVQLELEWPTGSAGAHARVRGEPRGTPSPDAPALEWTEGAVLKIRGATTGAIAGSVSQARLAAATPSGGHVAVAFGRWVGLFEVSRALHLCWLREVGELAALAIEEQARAVVGGTRHGEVQLWDGRDGACLGVRGVHATALAFAPGARRLACWDGDAFTLMELEWTRADAP